MGETLLYEGGWKEGMYEGKGKLYQEGKLVYEGNFKEGQKEGTGASYDKKDGNFRAQKRLHIALNQKKYNKLPVHCRVRHEILPDTL